MSVLERLENWIDGARRVNDTSVPLNGPALIKLLEDCRAELQQRAADKVTHDLDLQGKMLEAAATEITELRAALKSAQCPNPKCVGGYITDTGPDPQQDACDWCYGRHMLLEHGQG